MNYQRVEGPSKRLPEHPGRDQNNRVGVGRSSQPAWSRQLPYGTLDPRPALHIQIPREVISTNAVQVALAVRLRLSDRKLAAIVPRGLTELLKEESRPASIAVRFERTSPGEVEWTRLLPGFSAHDDPVNATQVDISDILEQRLAA